MEIYLIRHTTPQIGNGVCYGQSDIELANTFESEAQEVIRKIPSQFDAVYSSPLKRCTQLAALISPRYITDPRLMELNFGDWELQKWDDIPKTEINLWYADWVNVPAKKGESYLQLFERVKNFLNELPRLNKSAIVTHAGVLRCIVAMHNQVDLSASFKEIEPTGYGAVVQLKVT